MAALSAGEGVCDEDKLASIRFGVWTTQQSDACSRQYCSGYAIAANRFCTVKRFVGSLHHGANALCNYSLPARGANTDGHLALLASEVLDGEFCNGVPKRLGHRQCAQAISIRQHDDKLFASIARDDVARSPDVVLETSADRCQRIIAGLVTVSVVIGLETIEVDEKDRQWPVRTNRSAPLALKNLVQRTAIGQTGQRVRLRELAQCGFCLYLCPKRTREQDRHANANEPSALRIILRNGPARRKSRPIIAAWPGTRITNLPSV